jgi:hypothetical protein
LAFDEIRLAGTDSPQVTRRLTAALEDLMSVVPAERRPALIAQHELLRDAVNGSDRAQRDIDFAVSRDTQGIGIAAGR